MELNRAGPVPRGARPDVDVRWTGPGLVLHRNRTSGCEGRCELLQDGALRLTGAKLTDAGVYRQEVYDERGRCISRKEVTLTMFGQAGETLQHDRKIHTLSKSI